MEAEREYHATCHKAGETKEYKEWYKKIEPFNKNMEKILEEFYKNRVGKAEIKIVLNTEVSENASYEAPGDKMEKRLRNNLTSKELLSKLKDAQKEMQLFAIFLKKRFFTS